MSEGLKLYLDFCVFLLGAAIGSFANVCIYRMPREKSIVSPPSSCGSCGAPVKWYDNIPLVSFLVLRGRCRACGATYSFRYWFVELLNAVLWLAVWLQYRDISLLMVMAYCTLITMLVIGTFIDFEFYIIPNEITLGAIPVGIVFSVLAPSLQHTDSRVPAFLYSILGMVVGGVVLFLVAELGKVMFGRLKVPLEPGTQIRIEDKKLKTADEELSWEEVFNRESDRIRFQATSLRFQDKSFENVAVAVAEDTVEVAGQSYVLAEIGAIEATTDMLVVPREAMGLGDVKLLAGIGAFLGWKATLVTVFVSSIVGGLISMVLIVLNKKDWQSRIPYGPYIAFGAIVWIFWGQRLLDWYFNLLAR